MPLATATGPLLRAREPRKPRSAHAAVGALLVCVAAGDAQAQNAAAPSGDCRPLGLASRQPGSARRESRPHEGRGSREAARDGLRVKPPAGRAGHRGGHGGRMLRPSLRFPGSCLRQSATQALVAAAWASASRTLRSGSRLSASAVAVSSSSARPATTRRTAAVPSAASTGSKPVPAGTAWAPI